jgi:hypothetical protein
MNKQKARQLYELADRLSKLDVNTLSEQQLQQRSTMIAKLKEEVKVMREATNSSQIEQLIRSRLGQDAQMQVGIEGGKKFITVTYSPTTPLASIEKLGYDLSRIGAEMNFDGDNKSLQVVFEESQARDPELRSKQTFATNHYSNYSKDPDAAFDKWVQRSLMHSEEDDEKNVDVLIKLANKVSSLERKIATLSGDQRAAKLTPDLQRNHIDPLKSMTSESISEEFNGEYDDEAGMVQSNLRTMARAVNGLLDTIEDNDNLPEWAQEKLAKAEMMTTSVWDYLLSQKEQGMDPKVTEGSQQVDSLVTDTLRIMKGPEFNDAELAIKTVLGDRAYNERRSYYSFFINQLVDMYGKPEGSKTVDSLVTNSLAVMRGPTRNDAIAALKTTLGNEEYKSRSTFYKLWVNQAVDKYRQQGVTEAKKPSPKLTAVNIKKTESVSEEINTEAYERLQKVFAFKNYES